jgi:hypothetical protein
LGHPGHATAGQFDRVVELARVAFNARMAAITIAIGNQSSHGLA